MTQTAADTETSVHHGGCLYPKSDLRRMLCVLGAVARHPGASLTVLSNQTGLDRKTVYDLIEKGRSQAGVQIDNTQGYKLKDWGKVLNPEACDDAFKGLL